MDKSKGVVEMLRKQPNKKPEDMGANKRIKEDLGADSLDVVEKLKAIEDNFGVVVPDDVVMRVKTVGDLIKAIEEMTK